MSIRVGRASAGWQCGAASAAFCCGDASCAPPGEDPFNCSLDCGPAPTCGDGVCDAVEDPCSCAVDCGTPPDEVCGNGVDDDCDGLTDCLDSADCSGAPVCQTSCSETGASCEEASECCSFICRGKPGARTCK